MPRHFHTWYLNLSLRNKLLLTNFAASGSIILFALLSMSAFIYFSAHDSMNKQAHNLSRVIAENIAPAIYFDDRKTMKEILHGLREISSISSATLHDAQGAILATFQRNLPSEMDDPPEYLYPPPSKNGFFKRLLVYTQPIIASTSDRSPLGTLVLYINLSDMHRQITIQLAMLILIGGAGFMLISRMLLYLQKDISTPITQLTQMMDRVYTQRDLSIQSDIRRTDEIGQLAQGFNRMIKEIAQHNHAMRENEERLYQLNERLNILIEAIPDAIFFKDGEGRWLITNELAKQLFQLHNIPWLGKIEIELADLHPEFRIAHEKGLKDDERAWNIGQMTLFEEEIQAADGSLAYYDVREVPIFRQDGQRDGLLIIKRNITQRKKSEAEIINLAFYDTLTNLPNRRLLIDRLHHALAAGTRTLSRSAILFIDLDNFKTLNDTRGHDIGDLLLIEIAQRIQACVRKEDTVARFGGDEFVVMLESLSEEGEQAAAQARAIGEKIRDAINQPCLLQNLEYHGSCSIGVTMFDTGDIDISVDNLFKHADMAMYQAKMAGRNTVRFFDPQMQAALEIRTALETDLRQALIKQQFRLYYQIQVDSLRQPLGAEALLRWEHPERGLISPAQFILLAEETELIVLMGLWVLETACAQLKAWQNSALTRDLTLSVNVSAKQFHKADFVAQVHRVLLTSGANPSHLKLELTESIVLENVEDTITKMRKIIMMGVNFSMDDFGTGYSSLQYLKRLPLNQIKIDQSFVRDLTYNPNDTAIIQAIIAMSKALGLNVIAEGVETEAQREFLNKHGCHVFQGYLFGKPVPLEQLF